MHYASVNSFPVIVAGLFLAAMMGIIILLLIGIRADRKERDAVKGFDDHQDNYGNPGIEPDESQVIDWNIHNDHADNLTGPFPPERETQPMIPVELSHDEIVLLRQLLASTALYSLVIAYDPVDRAIKYKANGGTWSPPLGEPLIDYLD